MMGKEILGIYEIALFMACLPMDKITGIINQVAFSAFSSIQNDIQLAGTHYLKAVRILSVFSFPVFWGISCLSSEIIAVFLGPKWVEAALPLQIIAVVIPLRMVRNMMSPALFGLGYSKIVCANEAIGVVLMASAFYVASRYGLTGVSFVWLFAYPLVFILSLPPTAKALKLRILDVVKGMFRPALAGLVMIIMVELTRRTLPADYSMVVRMVVCIVVGAFVYLAVAVITNRRGLEEVMGLLRK
jgi:O-antigen/teichoic acid export membrane protein